MVALLQNRFERWIEARHRPQKAGIVLDRRHIYILPSAHGLGFSLLMLLLFLWSVNYNNSMGFALTFLLAGIALVAMWRCRNNLLDLRINALGAEPVFAGQSAYFGYKLDAEDGQPHFDIELCWPDSNNTQVSDATKDGAEIRLTRPAERRGWFQPGRLRIESRYPLGLFKAWSWLQFEQACLVYPKPEGLRHLPSVPSKASGVRQSAGSVQGSEDFAGLRRYLEGDSPRHIAWRASSRTGEFDDLQVKRFAIPTVPETWLDWNALGSEPVEARLSQLCRWVLQAEQAGFRYGLRLPDQELGLGQGLRHQQACLQALALYGENNATAS